MAKNIEAFTQELAEARAKDQAESEGLPQGDSIKSSEARTADSETALILTD